tara:strand:+ start:855 stop:2126 length:1272 start_codon:yes stop_codon:yes gene_type:complete
MIISKTKIIQNFIVLSFIGLFIMLSTYHKVIYGDGVRPFYSMGLVVSLLLLIWYLFRSKLSRSIAVTMIVQPQILLFIFLLIYIMVSAIFISSHVDGRQIKDHLYWSYWIIVVPLVPFYLVSRKINIDQVFSLLTKSIIIFSVFSSIIAYLIFFNIITISYGGLEWTQSVYLALRIHGIMGESTALGALLGLAYISVLYLKKQNDKSYKFLIIFLLVSIVATGSRNTLLCILIVHFIDFITEKLDANKIFFYPFLAFLVMVILLVIFYVTGITDIIYVIYFDRPDLDLTNKFSRPYIWLTTIKMISMSSSLELLFGHGASELRRELSAGFNSILEITYDFGIILSFAYLLLFVLSFYISYIKYKSSNIYLYKYSCLILVYGFIFSLFMTYFPTVMFNFASWGYVIGIWISAVPVQMMIKLRHS